MIESQKVIKTFFCSSRQIVNFTGLTKVAMHCVQCIVYNF